MDDGVTAVAAAPSAQRKERGRRVALGLLAAILLCLGAYDLRLWLRVTECERTFVVADEHIHHAQWDQALASLDQCLALNPLYFPAYEAKALVLVEGRGDKQAALEVLLGALPYLESDPRLLRAIGEMYLTGMHAPAQAEPYFARACAIDPDDRTTQGLLRLARDGGASSKRAEETRRTR